MSFTCKTQLRKTIKAREATAALLGGQAEPGVGPGGLEVGAREVYVDQHQLQVMPW